MSNQKNRKRMAENKRTLKKKVNTSNLGPAKIDREPNPSFSSEAKKLETAAKALSPANTGSAASVSKAGKFYGNMLRESFPPRVVSAVKKPAAKAASMLKEGGMVGRATGQGYGAARKGPNVV
tara:strand:+ start:234 stop:602 length:369 start_codon:yes stop_codon:yes gene_type:complete